MIANYAAILNYLPAGKPVVVLAVYPIDERKLQPKPTRDNNIIAAFNNKLQALAASYPDAHFLDAHHLLQDSSGNLASRHHVGDGIHLSPAAYALVSAELRKARQAHMSGCAASPVEH